MSERGRVGIAAGVAVLLQQILLLRLLLLLLLLLMLLLWKLQVLPLEL